jgi:outer membrane protein OmpA-like peptidoglycan-associated protein
MFLCLSNGTIKMRPTTIVLILLLCIGSVTAAVVGFQEIWRWPGLDHPAAVTSKHPVPQMQRSPAKGGTNEELAATESVSKPASASNGPGFDIARINPQGASVFAGRAEPNSNVTVLVDGRPVGSAHADENGEWVLIVERAFASEDPILSLKFNAGRADTSDRSPLAADARPNLSVDTSSSRSPPKLATATVTADLIDNLRHLVERARARNSGAIAGSPDHEPAQRDAFDRTPTKSTSLPGRDTLGTSGIREPAKNNGSRPDQVATTSRLPRTSVEKSGSPMHGGSVPVPISFVFDKAVLTDNGRQAAQLLIEYVLLEKFKSLKLTGHADERGTHAYNLALSSERLKTVADMLHAAGYSGELRLLAMGDTAPFTGVDRGRFSPEELYELDRRVELREAQP